MSTILPGNQESAALALDGGLYGLLHRRRNMMWPNDKVILWYKSSPSCIGERYLNGLITTLYNNGSIANNNCIYGKEAAAVTSITNVSWSGGSWNTNLGDMSALQYFTNATRIKYGINWDNYSGLVVLPPNIQTLASSDMNYCKSLNVHIVFTGATPPTSVNKEYIGYDGSKATFYFPDDYYNDYVTGLRNILNYCKSCETKPISELSSEERAKITII